MYITVQSKFVPTSDYTVECDAVLRNKFEIASVDELGELLHTRLRSTYKTPFEIPPLEGGWDFKEYTCLMTLAIQKGNDVIETLLLWKADVYFMNSEGRTIKRISV